MILHFVGDYRKGDTRKCNLQLWNCLTGFAQWETYSSKPCEFSSPTLSQNVVLESKCGHNAHVIIC